MGAWIASALPWLPTAAAAAVALVALVGARRAWVVPVAMIGAAAIAITVWQASLLRGEAASNVAQLHELSDRLTVIGQQLSDQPGSGAEPSFGSAVAALAARVAALEQRIADLREKYTRRRIAPEIAARIADFLRPLAPARVVISCPPNDAEAFSYANQLVGILREAGWEAVGPETTTIYGEQAAMPISLYVRGGGNADVPKRLVEAFTRFNVPFQSQIAASEAIPDTATIELYVPPKP